MGLMTGNGSTRHGHWNPDATRVSARQGRASPFDPAIRWLCASFVVSSLAARHSGRKLVARQTLVKRPRGLGDGLQRIGQVVESRLGGRRREAGRLLHLGVPGRRPDPVAVAPSGRPGEHRSVEGEPERRAQGAERAARIGLHVAAVDHRRGAAEPVGGAFEQRELGGQADLVEAERAGRACARRRRAPPPARG